MSEFDRAELSALLDGELSPAREREVVALIAADAFLLAEFEQLERMHARLTKLAQGSAFHPQVEWPQARPVSTGLALCIAAIALAWVARKLGPTMAFTLGVNAAALVLLVACLAPLALREVRAGRPLVA